MPSAVLDAPTSPQAVETHEGMTFQEAVQLLSREERFMATVNAMNTLLIEKGVYTSTELQRYYCQWAAAQQKKPKKDRPGWRAGFMLRKLFAS